MRAASSLVVGILLMLLASTVALAQEEPSVPADTTQAPPAAPTDIDVARDLLQQLDAVTEELSVLVATTRDAEGVDHQLMRVEALEHTATFEDLDDKLVSVIGRLEPEVATTDSIRQVALQKFHYQFSLYSRSWDTITDRLIDLRVQRDSAEPAALSELETRIGGEQNLVDIVLTLGVNLLGRMEALGDEAPELASAVDHTLVERSEQMAGRLQLAVLERNRIRERIASARNAGTSDQELNDERSRLAATEQRTAGIVASLDLTAEMMAKRGMDATRYRQLVIQTTGEVTDRILDWKVLKALVVDGVKNFGRWLRDQGPTWIIRLLILVGTIIGSRLVARLTWVVSQLFWRRSQASRLLSDLVGRLVVPTATVVGLVIGLWFLGVNPATLLTGLGVLSIIVGLALQDTLGNLAAGMFILIYRPYDVDDAVNAGGVVGVVKAMGLANTTIVTFDNRRLFVPNRKIWQEVIENRSVEAYRRVDMSVRISYRQDLETARGLIREVLAAQDTVLEEPAPAVYVANLDDSWVEIAVWPWATTENWWAVKTELPGVLKIALEQAGIAVPYPRREIAMINDDADTD